MRMLLADGGTEKDYEDNNSITIKFKTANNAENFLQHVTIGSKAFAAIPKVLEEILALAEATADLPDNAKFIDGLTAASEIIVKRFQEIEDEVKGEKIE